jgi:hypothetical protein
MLTHIPLDDQLNCLFYLDRGLWRLVYAPARRSCVYRREAVYLDVDRAAQFIVSGALLWTPPDGFEPHGPTTSRTEVQHEQLLLTAFLGSPFGLRVGRDLRARLELRIMDDRAWLMQQTIGSRDNDATGDGAS